MTAYSNFTVDFPKRIDELDRRFSPIAKRKELRVSYSLMKLAAVFLLPYERIEGTSGARTADISERQSIRKYLELDKRFHESSYCSNINRWALYNVDGFDRGPLGWLDKEDTLHLPAHKVLEIIRHSVAHSNLFFGGELEIEHVYFGSRRERDPRTKKYKVVRCTVEALDNLIDVWISNVQKLRVSSSLIWREFEDAEGRTVAT